jgi:hypothetical protein
MAALAQTTTITVAPLEGDPLRFVITYRGESPPIMETTDFTGYRTAYAPEWQEVSPGVWTGIVFNRYRAFHFIFTETNPTISNNTSWFATFVTVDGKPHRIDLSNPQQFQLLLPTVMQAA